MKKKRLYLLCSVCAICLIVAGVISIEHNLQKKEIFVSGIIASKTEDELILDSDLIVTGQVKEIMKSKWSNEDLARGENIRNILQTDIVVFVDEVIEGTLDQKAVTVRINKGEDAKTIVYSDGYPDFNAGEKVLLFLARDNSDVKTEEDYYVLTGMRQGKFDLKTTSGILAEKSDVYKNDKGEISVSKLKESVIEVKRANPNYKTEKIERNEEIRKNNIELFGK
jgi:hypothetical protein